MKTKVVMVTAMMALIMRGNMGMAQTAAPKTWADSVTVKGDIRYRYESIDDSSKTYTRERDRIRARLGVEGKCNNYIKTGIELSTGQSDPISGNQTIGGGFDKKDFKLNLAYLEYNMFGDSPNEVKVTAGKMKNPFILLQDDLVWDHDATPEGMAVKSRFGSGMMRFIANGARFWIQERSDKADLMLNAGQGALEIEFIPEITLTLGATYYGYENIKGYDVIDWEAKNNAYGNSTVNGTVHGGTTNKAWAAEFSPMLYFGMLDIWIKNIPVSFFAQTLENGDADKLNKGNMYGVSIGKSKNPGTWEVGYSHAKVEKDAVVGMLTDSDRWGGGTDGEGDKLYVKYQIMKNLQAGITYFMDEKPLSNPAKTKDYERLQIDLVASF